MESKNNSTSLTPTGCYIAVEVLIAVLAIAGNVLVCWAVVINRHLRNVTNYFIVSLAVADIAVGVLVIPFAITISIGLSMGFHTCLFLACLVLVLTQNSIFSLLAIAVDRYLSIKLPLRYDALVTGRHARKTIAVLWIISLIIGLIPLFGWNNWMQVAQNCTDNTDNTTSNNLSASIGTTSATASAGFVNTTTTPNNQPNWSCKVKCQFEKVMDMRYMVYFNFFGCVLPPLLIMLGIYIKIFLVARAQLKQINMEKGGPGRSKGFLLKQIHAAKSLSMIVGLFAICWLPLHILNCIHIFCPNCEKPSLWLMDLAIVLSHANSVVNPVIYAYRLREFRLTFYGIVFRTFHKNKELSIQGNTSIMHSLDGQVRV
ncbi:adenosine receptor A2b-like [Protopterus annectens]|uniref:adenosine receptor A2b-like n=1 Tax=Protopterus annectens TaxID=7888 RepID=UPI001CFB95CF|nr:adenosine receptor A2b-like [Protopterus annectens]